MNKDRDIELSDAQSHSDTDFLDNAANDNIVNSQNPINDDNAMRTAQNRSLSARHHKKDGENDEDEDEEENEDDDEDAVLQRLTGNYRRFSETKKSRDPLDVVTHNQSSSNQNVQVQLRELENNNEEDGMAEDYGEDDEEEHSEHYSRDNINNHQFYDDDDDDDGSEGERDDDSLDGHSDGETEHSSAALRMLANALSAARTNGNLEDFESLINSALPGATARRSASSSNQGVNRGFESPAARSRMMVSSFMDHFMGGPERSQIAGLIDGLETHSDPYIVMETLNEISSTLLMMTSLQSERQVPTHRLAKALVDVIAKYPDHLELQLVACRCIYSLTEVNYNVMSEIVSAGVIECLNEKLLDLSYIDMAEQALQALEMISRRAGKQCLKKGSISVVLSYLDFFTIHAQRKALKIVSNAVSSKYLPPSALSEIAGVFPTIKTVAITYTDSQCVESAWLVISNIVTKFASSSASKLIDLLDIAFLKRLCENFPNYLGTGKNSTGLVSFKTVISMLESLSLLALNSAKFSDQLFSYCDVVHMVSRILSLYEQEGSNKNTSALDVEVTSIVNSENVSIDALLKCPKELLTALLRLLASVIPSTIKANEDEKHIDLGNYTTTVREVDGSPDEEKMKLLGANPKSQSVLASMLPLLLNIFDASVDYKIRRLVLILTLRITCLMSPDQLSLAAKNTKLVLTLASTIAHGKHLINTKGTPQNKDEIKSCSFLFGSLLITEHLVKSNPGVFLNEFAKEGVFAQLKELIKSFDEVKGQIVDSSSSVPLVGEYSTHDSEDDYADEDEEMGEEDYASSDEYDDHHSMPDSVEVNIKKRDDIMNDGLKQVSRRSLFESLASLTSAILDDYQRLSLDDNVVQSGNLKLLKSISKTLKEDAYSFTLEEWGNVWKQLVNTLDPTTNASPVSSFELVASGIVNALLTAFSNDSNKACVKSFEYIFCSSLSPCLNEIASPLAMLVKKLEEAIDRNESFEIAGTDSDANQTSRFRAASMTKQMKIKLVSIEDDKEAPSKSVLLVVHAIATFETIQNFIKKSKSINLKTNFNLNSSFVDDDYHYDFYSNNQKIPSDATIFGAMYRSNEDNADNLRNLTKDDILRKTHTIGYKAVAGKLVSNESLFLKDSIDDSLETIEQKDILNLLKLLKIFYEINSRTMNPSTTDAIFLNYKLTAKLNRQLDEPLLVASGILPDWAVIIPREFPFLFPMESRLFFLRSTSYGYSRLIDYWISKSKEDSPSSDSMDSDMLARNQILGRSIRHKLRISREKIFASAIKVMEMYATNPGLIEIEFFDEVGSGLGPTLEFYSDVSREFSRLKLYMWRSDNYGRTLKAATDQYVKESTGLFPRPMHKLDAHLNNTLFYFKVLGKFLARSLLDSRLVDFHFNPLFFELAMKLAVSKRLSFELDESIRKVRQIDKSLASSLTHLVSYLHEYSKIPKSEWENAEISGAKISDLMLTFVLPGYEEIKLIPDGDEVAVTSGNLENYINKILDYTINGGIIEQIKSFVSGFSEIFPFTSLMLFSPDELTKLSGKEVESWTKETLISVVHADHGYNSNSSQIEWLIDIMSSFNDDERRDFLKFLTGSPRLPFDGFNGLSPQFTVVMKHTEDGLKPDDYLPSVMTCANYLKLPSYSSKVIMRSRIIQAIKEGGNAFLLS